MAKITRNESSTYYLPENNRTIRFLFFFDDDISCRTRVKKNVKSQEPGKARWNMKEKLNLNKQPEIARFSDGKSTAPINVYLTVQNLYYYVSILGTLFFITDRIFSFNIVATLIINV